MANLYKDADKRRRVPPGGAQKAQEEAKTVDETTTPAEIETIKQAPVEAVVETVSEKEEKVENQPVADSEPISKVPVTEQVGFSVDEFDKRSKEEAEKAKNKNKINTSFTLSPEVRDELQKRYKRAKKKSVSEYLDDLLKDVFNLK